MSLLIIGITDLEGPTQQICHLEDSQPWNSVKQLWRRGPEWLLAGVDSCPQLETPSAMPEECSLELKAKAVRSLNLVTTDTKRPIGKLIECEKFSSLMSCRKV